MKKILFVTTHNLATNPRLVKEAELALANNFQVDIICFEFDNWSKVFNDKIKKYLKERGAVIHIISAGRRPFIPWIKSILKERVALLLLPLLQNNVEWIASALFRRHTLIVNLLDKINDAHIVVGHNPGAMLASVMAAKKLNCKVGFDVEDYHPGEGHNKVQQHYCKKLMKALLPSMNYVSFASAQIKHKVEKDLGKADSSWFTVLNYFPSAEFVEHLQSQVEGKVKFVWFSQNINTGRGLELILPALSKYASLVELHLYGNMNADFFSEYLSGASFIVVHEALVQQELHKELSYFDIGLALEPIKDLNNDLALSNKMLSYFQAGLYILASNTSGQSSFMNEFSTHGMIFDFNSKMLDKAIENIIGNIKNIRTTKHKRYQNAQQHSWEAYTHKLLKAWQ